MIAYYNDNDPFACSWLQELMNDGLIAPGVIDNRSIEDVRPSDLAGFTQHHFFAGIGIWSLALRCAGWPDARPVWTGSCPCQPFSGAGKGAGFTDERHLWPAFYWLICQCRPDFCFGEQVASQDGLAWLDYVHAEMEAEGYAFGEIDTCAAGFGAPHKRQRLFFCGVAQGNTVCARLQGFSGDGNDRNEPGWIATNPDGSQRTRMDRLGLQARLAGWPSPVATDSIPRKKMRPSRAATNRTTGYLSEMVPRAGWTTPCQTDHKRGGKGITPNMTGSSLAQQAAMTGPARLTASGEMLTGSSAQMVGGGQLCPVHSLWLMLGQFATAWERSADRVTRSRSRKRRSS